MKKDSKNNIKFNYMYRDGANYKQYGEIIFKNDTKLGISEMENIIKSNLIDEMFFYPTAWNIPLIYEYTYNPDIDHDWYTFESLEETHEDITDSRTISEFLQHLRNKV